MTTYSVRLTERAIREFQIEVVRLSEIAGDTIALDWDTKMKQAITSLSTFPRIHALAREEEVLEQGVRVLLFRRTPSGPAWRVFYTIEEPPIGLDGFVVRVRHIRHGASPLTAFDAKDLLVDT
jgi:plasmid stabilization system protein ParE